MARSIADRREGLARLNGQVNAARSRAASAQAEIDRLAATRDEAQERAVTAQEEYEALQAEVDGLDAGDAELTEQHEETKRQLSEAEAALTAAREAATAAERKRAATQARHEALALGLRRKDGTGILLGARDGLTGVLGPAAELLTVTPGHEVALAAAFGAAADAIAVTTPASAADAIRLLRKQDGGRAALLLAGCPDDPTPATNTSPRGAASHDEPADNRQPFAADFVRAPADLMPAVRRLLRNYVVVETLEDAEQLVYTHPELTAVTAEGDLLGAHFAHGGSAGAPSLLEVQASVDEAAAELEELAVRCEELATAQQTATERRKERAAQVEELGSAAEPRSARSPPWHSSWDASRARRGAPPARLNDPPLPPRERRTPSTRPWKRLRFSLNGWLLPRRCRSRRSLTPLCGIGLPLMGPMPGRPRWRRGFRSVRTRSGSRGWPGGPMRWTGGPGRAGGAGAGGAAARPVAPRGRGRGGRGLRGAAAARAR